MSEVIGQLLLIGFLLAPVIYFCKRIPVVSRTFSSLIFLFAAFCFAIKDIKNGVLPLTNTPLELPRSSLDSTLFDFFFYLDGLSLTMVLMITFIGFFVFIYGQSYFTGKEEKYAKCMSLLQIFLTAMLGIVTSGNLLLLFLFWEITTITSYILIGFNNESENSRNSALTSLLITGSGGVCLLAGIILLGSIAGTLNIDQLINLKDQIIDHEHTTIALTLIFLGAFTKSAQFPFHVWLPRAMSAPTPVSSYLHSATMVKAGVFLLARLYPIFVELPYWQGTLKLIGGITAIWAAYLAIKSHDLKGILAYTTISALGTLTVMLGIGTPYAIKGFYIFLIVHGLYKAGLFMMVGAVDKSLGTRDIRDIGGLKKKFPLLALATLFLCLSMSGFPPFLGFLSKEVMYEAQFKLKDEGFILSLFTILTNMLTIAVAFKVFYEVYIKKAPAKGPQEVKPLNFFMIFPSLALAFTALILGLIPGIVEKFIIAPGLSAQGVTIDNLHLSLWHGFNFVLLISGVTVAGGVVLFYTDINWPLKLPTPLFSWFETLKKWAHKVIDIGHWQKEVFFPESYRGTLMMFFIFISLSLLWSISYTGLIPVYFEEVTITEILIFTLITVPAISALFFFSRISAILITGISGSGVALLYAYYSAPDLALTQILVETLVLILFVFVLHKLPEVQRSLSTPGNMLAALIAALFASAMLVGVSLIFTEPIQHRIADYFRENSLPEAFGHNVVNVILVDFRSFDTLGEITVLAIATVGIMGLMGSKKIFNLEQKSQSEKENEK